MMFYVDETHNCKVTNCFTSTNKKFFKLPHFTMYQFAYKVDIRHEVQPALKRVSIHKISFLRENMKANELEFHFKTLIT